MEDSEQIDLIDFSSENDNLIFNLSSPPPPDIVHQSSENQKDLKSFKVLGDMDAGKEGDLSQDNDQIEQVPELVESEEPQRTRRNGKCNLRKSLAWDSAFFTSAGVLDPEELSSIIKGTGKREKHLLPGIQEDIRISSDSISTLESDSLTLESLDTELFEDIRASIQKSCKAVKNSCGITASEEASKKAISSPKVDLASANQLKPKPVMKRTTGLPTTGMPKCQPKMSTGIQGSGKAMKLESACSQVPKSALRIRESTSSVPKPPKEIRKVNSTLPATTKRDSLGANRVKTDNDNAKTGRGTQALKAPVSSGARRGLPKPSSSSKSSSLGPSTITKTQSTRSSTGENSGSTLSGNGGKSPVATVRRKVATRMLNPPSSSSTAKTPSRSALKSKSISKNSTLSAHLMSSKISSNISPASSIGEWSSASSSSSVTQRSNKSRASVGSSSSRSLEIDTPSSDLKTHSDDHMPDAQENQGIVLPDENMRKSSVQNGTLSRSASVKPSGLRMPSPKIGFFDGVKSVRTPNGTLQSHSSLPTAFSKTGARISSKVGKLPTGRVLTALANIKPETEKPNSPSSSQEKSTNLDGHDEKVVESCLKSVEVGGEERDEAKCDADAGFGAIVNQNLGVPKNEMSLDRNEDPCLKDVKMVGVDGEYSDSNLTYSPNINSSGRLDGDSQHHLRSNVHSHCKIDEKENVHCGDQVDGLSKHDVGVKTDINCQIVESLRNFEPMSVTFFETTSEISASRTPLAVKNSICHSASGDFSQVSADLVLEKAVVDLPHLEGDHKESIKQSLC